MNNQVNQVKWMQRDMKVKESSNEKSDHLASQRDGLGLGVLMNDVIRHSVVCVV